MPHFLDAVLTTMIPVTSVPPILTALGLTSSIITFVLTNILARPAMVRWRRAAWRTFALLWVSVIVCFVDLLYFGPIWGVWSLGTKLALLLWASALVRLLWLVHRIFFTSFTHGRPAWLSRRLSASAGPRFEHDPVPAFGVPFIDGTMAESLRRDGGITFPILLMSDRGVMGSRSRCVS